MSANGVSPTLAASRSGGLGYLNGIVTRLEQYIIVVVRINSHRNSKLAQVVQAFDAFTLFLALERGGIGLKHAGQGWR